MKLLFCIGSVLFCSLAQVNGVELATSEALAQEKLRKFDKNNDGVIDASDNIKMWKRIKKLDKNKDQKISLEELSKQKDVILDNAEDIKRGLIYKKTKLQELYLDLYLPKNQNNQKVPFVVYTHGGGWAAGSRNSVATGSFGKVFNSLLEAGFAVASVEYRLCSKGNGVQMRDCVIDCKDAIRYLSKHHHVLNLNPNQVYVMGDSAGGQIAQMLALSDPKSLSGESSLANETYQIIAGVSWYGPCDFEKVSLFNHDDRDDFKDRFGGRILSQNNSEGEKLRLYREMSPIQYLKKESPPLLMIQGDKDTTIPVKHAYYMQDKAKEIGANVEVVIVENSGHNWRKVEKDIQPSRSDIEKMTSQFFIDRKGS